jgi:ElaA protein
MGAKKVGTTIARVILHVAGFDELSAGTLYALLRLRVDVFVVEQRCPYPELDGRDTEPGTRHVWLASEGGTGDGTPLAYLRILDEPDGTARIGRVCVAATARGAGLAGRLMRATLDLLGTRRSVLDAQTYLAGFYAGLGYEQVGPEFVEDGIPHVPMRRQGSAQGSVATSSAIDRR